MEPATLVMAGNVVMDVSGVMIDALKALYGTVRNINDYINEQIDDMKINDNPTVARTGDVLDKAKYGFGVGFAIPVVVIATGQLILGNPLTAATTVITAPLNPIAMTCAAVGAIYYGWNVLTDKEKEEIISRISHGLKIGSEMIKSVIRFIIEKTKEIWSSEHLVEIRKDISTAAAAFGKTLGDITGKIGDIVADTFNKAKKATGEVVEKTGKTISETIGEIKEQGEKAIKLMTPNKNEQSQETLPNSICPNAPSGIKVKLNGKGQLTIPKGLREQLGLNPLSEVELIVEDGNVTLSKVD